MIEIPVKTVTTWSADFGLDIMFKYNNVSMHVYDIENNRKYPAHSFAFVCHGESNGCIDKLMLTIPKLQIVTPGGASMYIHPRYNDSEDNYSLECVFLLGGLDDIKLTKSQMQVDRFSIWFPNDCTMDKIWYNQDLETLNIIVRQCYKDEPKYIVGVESYIMQKDGSFTLDIDDES